MKKSNDLAGIPEFSVSHRLKIIQELLKIRSVAAFANEIGVDTSVLNNIMSPYGRMGKPSFDTLQKIAQKFPRVNMDWLITGKGEPLRPFSTGGTLSVNSNYRQSNINTDEMLDNGNHERGTNTENIVTFPEMDVAVLLSDLRICRAEKENLIRILALKDEIIAMLRKQIQV